jgi:hypothetical protein
MGFDPATIQKKAEDYLSAHQGEAKFGGTFGSRAEAENAVLQERIALSNAE